MSILAICGGNGVLAHPFKKHLIGNIEPRTVFHTPDHIQWRLNFNIPFDKDPLVRFPKSDVSIIVGAPDCGHSSVLAYSRAKKLSDPKLNTSLSLYLENVDYYRPEIFMMENLPKLLESDKTIIPFFESLGYRVFIYEEPVSAWGNSQINRKRLIIIGISKNLKNKKKYFRLPKERYLKSSGELIEGLGKEEIPELCHVRELDDWRLPMYYGDERNISVKQARNLWKQYGTRKWPVPNSKMNNQPGVYRNLDSDYPMTVRKQSRQFREDGYLLTPREMARIQGVPDNFKLHFEEDRRLYFINKARATVTKCPPYQIGEWFNKCLIKMNYYG
jgi:site-specific DNA-cytosine methylase